MEDTNIDFMTIKMTSAKAEELHKEATEHAVMELMSTQMLNKPQGARHQILSDILIFLVENLKQGNMAPEQFDSCLADAFLTHKLSGEIFKILKEELGSNPQHSEIAQLINKQLH